MSALPPKADILGRHEKGLLLTQSGHPVGLCDSAGMCGTEVFSAPYFLRTNRRYASRGKAIPAVVQFGYDRHKSEGYLGNVD